MTAIGALLTGCADRLVELRAEVSPPPSAGRGDGSPAEASFEID